MTVTDLKITKAADGQAKHGINVYKSTGVTLNNVSMSNVDGRGLVINASNVTATGTLTLDNNGWDDTINVGFGTGINGWTTGSSLDASNATLVGVDAIYADSGDMERASKCGGIKVTAKDDVVVSLPGVAEFNGWKYNTLADAVEAVVDSTEKTGTVTLLKDASGSGIGLFNDNGATEVNLTIDFGGHTYTCGDPAVGSAGTESQGFHLEKGNTVTLKNGTIAVSESSTKTQMLIQNYCDLTLSNLKLQGNAMTQYLISCNYGDMALTNVSMEGTHPNVVAIDLMHWIDSVYADAAPTMSINNRTEDSIKGSIDVYCYNNGVVECEDVPELTITGGTFSVDPTEYVASGYSVRQDGETYVVYRPSSGGGSSSSGNKTETVTNPDGSTTTTVTKPDGSTTETTKTPDGSTSVVNTDKDGQVTATVTVSSKAVADAEDVVDLPMPEVPVTTDRDEAPVVTVKLPGNASARVMIPVEDVTPGTVAILVNADGTEEIVMDSITTEDGVVLTVKNGAKVKIVDNAIDFIDVKDSYWGADAIDFVTSRELFTGTSSNKFSPENTMTRAMVVTVLARYEGVDTSTGDEWYEAGAAWAVENGISDGSNLNASVTREQLVTMLYRYAGEPAVSGSVTGFPDAASVSDWAEDAMVWALENGLINGMTDGNLKPQATATRAQVAAILARFVANVG